MTLSSSSPGELEIAWNAAGQEATDYRVNWARSDEDFPSWNETEGNSYPTTNSLTLTGLDQGVQYKVQVRARYGGDGAHSGPWSGVARATVAAEGSGSGAGNPPAAPTGLLTAATHDSVLLAWDNPDDDGVTGYRVLRRVRTEGNELKVIAPDTGSAATSYTDETVAAETAYEYQVKAINARGVSEASASANANTPAAPVLRQDDPPVEDDEPQPETAQQQSGGDIIIVDGPGRKLVSRRFVTPGIEHYQTVDGGVPYSSRIHRDAFDTSYSSIDLIAGNRYTVHITGRDRESGEDGGTDPLRKGHLYGIFEPDNLLTPHAIRIVPASGWVDEDSDHSPTEDVVWNFVARKTGRHSIRTNGKAFECLLYDGKRHNCTYAGFYLVRVTSGADDGDRAGAVGLGEIAWMRGMESTRPFVQALARGNQIGGSDRVDYYSFSFEQRAQILLNLTDLDINVNLYLEDEDGKTILATNQPGSDDIELTRALNPGRYYVRITSTASTAGVYRFTYHVIAAAPSAALDALRISPKDIIGFKPYLASYEVGMASTVTRATITPIARDSTASIGYSTDDADTGSNARGHQVDLSAGKNTVTVTVRSGSLTEEYTVNINRGVSAGYGWKAADDLDGLIAAGNDSAYGIWSNASTIWVADNSDGKLYAYRKSDKTRDSGKDFDTLTAAGNENPTGIWSDDATMWVLQESGRIYAYRMSDKAQDTTKEFTTLARGGRQ